MTSNKGQAIVMLILIMTVALAIGLSIVQKSLVDVSTSSKVEQSSRAFSAAEAGVEKALTGDITGFTAPNNSSSSIIKKLIPAVPPQGQQDALEILNLKKEDVGQVWLADYTSTVNPPPAQYTNKSLEIYWGDPAAKNPDGTQDYAALELTLVDYGTGVYKSTKWYLDSTGTRNPANGFTSGAPQANCNGNNNPQGTTVAYYCTGTIDVPAWPILLRARLLYNTNPQPFAVRTTKACPGETSCLLPAQKTVIDSVGTSGETQRKVNVTQTYQQVPHYFDYAIFSVGSINK